MTRRQAPTPEPPEPPEPAPGPRAGAATGERIEERIHAEARAIGFEAVGFAPAADPGEGARLRAWLAASFHGGMGYLARAPGERASVARWHPWARSVVCVLRSYQQPRADGGPGHGRVAAYALGDDYHDWMRRDLHRLAGFLRAGLGARTRVAVDTAPILERPYAREAGLGWIGKNTLLLSRTLGSTTFLGEILCDLELAAGRPVRDHCGSCRRCLDVCPTNAFPAPYVLDARRCISYLTIEHRGVIDRELRPGMGRWIFGCDLCQDVCPWNKFAQPTTAGEASAARDLAPAELSAFLALDEDSFRRRFRRSPIYRARRDGFLRNVAIALGNSGVEASVEPLARALGDPSWLVRLHAAWGLGELGRGRPFARRATAALEARRVREPDVRVAREIRHALARLGAESPARSVDDPTGGT